LQNPKRKTIGLRVPDHPIAQALLETLGEPLMSSTLIFPGEDMPETDVHDMRDRISRDVDLVIDGDHCGLEPTTVIDMVEAVPRIVRQGCGIVEGIDG
jgi:tRNA threonylcarbamoyl adenosine modification protein (Sua5/YciO/YrdC/YwlC family)